MPLAEEKFAEERRLALGGRKDSVRGSLFCMNPTIVKAVLLLVVSNVFMTFAWYAHLRDLRAKPLIVAILVSWSVALLEYVFQVPANRIGSEVLTLPQLKIIQEVITLSVFVPFALFYMKTELSWNYLFAGLCMIGAVFFIFRG